MALEVSSDISMPSVTFPSETLKTINLPLVQGLAIALGPRELNAGGVSVTHGDVLNGDLHRTFGPGAKFTEIGRDFLPALLDPGYGPVARGMPRGIFGEDVPERIDVASAERFIAPPH